MLAKAEFWSEGRKILEITDEGIASEERAAHCWSNRSKESAFPESSRPTGEEPYSIAITIREVARFRLGVEPSARSAKTAANLALVSAGSLVGITMQPWLNLSGN